MKESEYFPTFAQLSSLLRVTQETINSKRKIAISGELLKELIMCAIGHLEFDEKWYLSKYADLREAWEKGSIKDLREHFIVSGYFEGRLPRELSVDEKWYLDVYEDVRQAVAAGKVASAVQHYVKSGQFEYRSPSPSLDPLVRRWRRFGAEA